MKRQGLNCLLAYRDTGNQVRGYRCRAFGYVHNFTQIAEEGDNARLSRAYYPHRVTMDQFAITVQLKGYTEWQSFNVWMTDYAKDLNASTVMQSSGSPAMTVLLLGRAWSRVGIPMSGYGFGDHLGAILWQPQIVFQAISDPNDRNPIQASSFNDTSAVLADKVNIPNFYPFSQNASGTADTGLYDQIAEIGRHSKDYVDNNQVQLTIGQANSVPTQSGSPPSVATNTPSTSTVGSAPTNTSSTSWEESG